MKRLFIASGIVALVLISAIVYFYAGGQAPPGQPALTRLKPQNVAEVKNAFNEAKDEVRILLLLSPT